MLWTLGAVHSVHHEDYRVILLHVLLVVDAEPLRQLRVLQHLILQLSLLVTGNMTAAEKKNERQA